MLSDLLFSFNAVIPIFLIMLLGFVVRRLNIIDTPTTKQMNTLAFKVVLPIMLFNSVHGSDYSQMLDLKFVAFLILSIITFFFICWIIAIKLIDDNKKKGAFIQGSFRGNYVILGVALSTEVLGFTPPIAVTGVILVVPIFNILSVIILTIYGEQKTESGSIAKQIIKSIVTNPLIIAIFTGITLTLLNIEFPPLLNTPINMVASLATPFALLVIGASLDFSKIKDRLKHTLIASILKLIVMPAIFMPLAIWLGISAEGIVVLLVLYAAPTAIVSYVMSSNMGADEHLASSIVVFSSLFSILTYTIGVYILRVIGVV
ncbi:MAG: AEC family transporter [Oscillospiraceae bacterium]|nr:AEC family transporter [Oscillospiraceae bacterium]